MLHLSRKNSVLFIFSLWISLSVAVRTRSRAMFGEYCDNRSIRCDTTLSLTCKDQACSCMKPETMIYDTHRSTCVALAGEKCKFTVVDESRRWQEEILCVAHAHCESGVCTCDRNYMELSNGTCIPKKSFNESCNSATDCKQDFSLICSNGKCLCNPGISEYIEENKQCVGLADKPCVNDLCTSNAICREEARRVYYASSSEADDSDEYSEVLRDPTSVGRCQCRTAFGVTPEGRCQLGFGGKCDHHTAKCMNWLKCKEGTCVCKYPSHQIYDKRVETCVSRVGGPCSDTDDGDKPKIQCISGATCSRKNGSQKYQCSCPLGFIENADRGCDLDYDQRCNVTQTSSKSYAFSHIMKCDRVGNLFCIDGRCKCEDDLHIYNHASQSCKGLVGALCLVHKSECVPGSFCNERRGAQGNEGFCQCQEFYVENKDGTCTPRPQVPPQILPLTSAKQVGGSDELNVSSNFLWSEAEGSDD